MTTTPTDVRTSDSAGVGGRFLIVWAGQTLSAIGSTLSGVGLGVWVFLETGSAAWLGVLLALAGLPTVVLMPLMHHLDRLSRRTVMIAGDLLSAASAFAVLTLALADRVEIWHLAVAAFVNGAGGAFQMPAFQAAIPSLVPAEALGRANGLTQFGPAVGITIGPLLAAPVVGWWGLAGIVVIDLVTFAIAVATTIAVSFGDVPIDDARPVTASDDGSARSALRWLRGTGRALFTLLITMAVVNLALTGSNVAIFALSVEIGGTSLAGIPLAAGGVAMIVGSIVVGARGLPRRRIRVFAVGLWVVAFGFCIAATRPSLVAVTVGIAAALVIVPAVNAAMATVFHEHVPGPMQGRVFALRGAISQALGPAGSLAAGIVITGVAEPAMADGGWGARSIGRVIGTGTERAPALMMIGVSLALVLLGIRLATSWVVDELDTAKAGEPTDGPAHDTADDTADAVIG